MMEKGKILPLPPPMFSQRLPGIVGIVWVHQCQKIYGGDISQEEIGTGRNQKAQDAAVLQQLIF